MRCSYHVKRVLNLAGFEEDDFNDELIAMAQVALDKCYYEDRAVEYLWQLLDYHI